MRSSGCARWQSPDGCLIAPTPEAEARRDLAAAREGRLLLSRLDAWLLDQARPYLGRRVLEIGCGHGNLTRLLLDREQVVAIDVDPDSVRVMRERFGGDANVTPLIEDITSPGALALRRFDLDTAISVNVLEHIADDMTALRHIHEIVAPGGHVIAVAPAHPWLYGSMDRAVGHYRRYTRASLRARLDEIGAQVVVIGYTNMLGALGWWLHGKVLRRRGPQPAQLRAFDRLVPLLRRIEGRLGAPFGLSVVSVSKKRPAPLQATGAFS